MPHHRHHQVLLPSSHACGDLVTAYRPSSVSLSTEGMGFCDSSGLRITLSCYLLYVYSRSGEEEVWPSNSANMSSRVCWGRSRCCMLTALVGVPFFACLLSFSDLRLPGGLTQKIINRKTKFPLYPDNSPQRPALGAMPPICVFQISDCRRRRQPISQWCL
jgi:hypothetical protein